ncbi:putative ferric-chelate reductase 1-like protein, partial [Leptotrombidium deliense]
CYSRGAPNSQDICKDLTPRHGVSEQSVDHPFWVEARLIAGTTTVNVTIHAPPHQPFKGFLLQARDEYDSIINGEFSESPNTKPLTCLNTRFNTLTHNSGEPKTSVSTIWRSHSSATLIRFKATIVQQKIYFWKNVLSTAVELNPNVATSTEESKPQTSFSFPDVAYESCDVNKTCFGLKNCVGRKSCDILLTGTMVNDDTVSFELYGNIKNAATESRWFSMGISHDISMGDDSVTDCIAYIKRGTAMVKESFNIGKDNREDFTNTIKIKNYAIKDGYVYCQWERNLKTTVNEKNYDLTKNYILLAYGSFESNGIQKSHHDDREYSASVIDFTVVSSVASGGIDRRIKAHGSLMVIAWLGTVSIAIMLARHYKQVWEDKTIFGNKVWFNVSKRVYFSIIFNSVFKQCHRGLMMTSITLAIISMICIFTVYGWKINTTHSYFGVSANIFMFLNPIGALFRCHPGTENRWIFNWLHWFGGNAGQICAIVAIFLATYLKATGLSMVFLWLVVAYLAMHITTHLIMQIHARHLINDNKGD